MKELPIGFLYLALAAYATVGNGTQVAHADGGRGDLLSLTEPLSTTDAPNTRTLKRPHVLSEYKSTVGRRAQHAGMDFDAPRGTPVIAAADGDVVSKTNSRYGCGKGVILYHLSGKRFTVYCHMKDVTVSLAQTVHRGDVIGHIGTSGNAGRVPHVHFEVSSSWNPHGDGNLHGTENPAKYIRGCYDSTRTYPDGFVLSYPVGCGG